MESMLQCEGDLDVRYAKERAPKEKPRVKAQLDSDAATTTTTPSCHRKEAKFEARKSNGAIKNAQMKF